MNFQELVLSSLIPRSQVEKYLADEAFKELARARIPSSYFSGNHNVLFGYVFRQNSKNTILDRDILESYLSQEEISDEKKNEIRILFNTCKEQAVSIDKLKEVLPAFVDQMGILHFGDALQTSTRILTEGLQSGREKLYGLTDAKRYLIDKISGLLSFNSESFPEGDILECMDRLWEMYCISVNNPNFGIKTGEKEIDALTGGVLPGELWAIAGFAKEGKSQRLRNWAYHASMSAKNVVYFSLEMGFDQLLRQFVSLHSCNPKFNNPFGIEEEKIAFGRLSSDEKNKLEEVTDDFKNNKEYGKLQLVQLPYESTVSTIREKLLYLNSLWKVDAVYLDYASLLKPEFYKNSTITETTQVFNMLKQLALTFNNGKAIPIITCHQISRVARTEAEKSEQKRYGIGAMADAAGVERACDFITWILRLDEMVQRREVKCGVYYSRRTGHRLDWLLMERYKCSKLNSIDMSKEINEMGPTDLID